MPDATVVNVRIRSASSVIGSPVRTAAQSSSASSSQAAIPDSEATPRPTRDSSSRSKTSIKDTSAHYSTSLFDDRPVFDRPSLPSASTRSSTSRQSSASKRSTSPLKSMATLGEAGVTYDDLDDGELLGEAGDALYQDLYEITSMVGIYPAEICQDISNAIQRKHRIHDLYKNDKDSRSREQLLFELSEIQNIKRLSKRCSRDMEGEAEWNNAVHSTILRLALGTDDPFVGWRYIPNAKIDSRYLPLMSDGLTSSSKMIDYALFIGDDQDVAQSTGGVNEQDDPETSRNIRLDQPISMFIRQWSDSINHVSYTPLRYRPILLGIETKTVERTEAEARMQLGIWIAAHIRRIWSLGGNLASSEADKLEQTIQDMVFPLIYVQSAKWSLMFARPFFTDTPEGRSIKIVIYHDISLGETSSIQGIYQLLQAFRVLRKWGNEVYRGWWGGILDIVSEGG
ncbi:hypothetical protein F66182_4290 [Fusarium sp. NRRL 66182]|nr:hypothetical protein F66182_4290 [Fusarium sp. NRRL 66182]